MLSLAVHPQGGAIMFGRRRSCSLVGVDIGTHSIKLVQLQEKKDGWHLERAFTAVIPPDCIVDGSVINFSAVAECLRGLVQTGKLEGSKCVISVAGHSTIIKKITLPSMTLSELQESIGWEAEQYIPFDIKEVYVDVQIVSNRESEGQMDVLLTAVKKSLVNELTQVATDAGLNVVMTDFASLAVINACIFNGYTAPGEIIACVDVGDKLTSIGVLNGNQVAFNRDISTGSGTLTGAIQNLLNVRYEEAEELKLRHSRGEEVEDGVVDLGKRVADVIAMEVQRSLDFFTATSISSDIARVVVMGGGCAMPGLIDAIQRRMELPVEIMKPFRNINADFLPGVFENAPYAVAVGLALRHEGDFALDFSLQPGYRVNLMPQVPKKPKRSFLPKVFRSTVELRIRVNSFAYLFVLLLFCISVTTLGFDLLNHFLPKTIAPACECVCPNSSPLSTDTPKKPETLDLDR